MVVASGCRREDDSMNQWLAVVLGAGLGAVGALGAAILAYVAARRQARDQGLVDHDRQLRAERREAYLTFHEAAGLVDDVLLRLGYTAGADTPAFNPLDPTRLLRRSVTDLGQAVHQLRKVRMAIDIVGPVSVANSAREVWYATREIHEHQKSVRNRRGRQPEFGPSMPELVRVFNLHRESFTETVRQVMEEPPR